jgi:hypothetical protein
MAEKKVFNPDVLDSIQPFSGTLDEMSAGERMLTEGKALQKVETQYVTAITVQRPRSIARITHNVLEEAKLAGAEFFYRWEVWDKRLGQKVPIEGESIDLAMCIARHYGNCVVDIEGSETATHYMLKGVFVDLENGVTIPRLYRQRKSQKLSDKMDADRQEDIAFQIGQSKAQRNAISKAMPNWLIKQAIDAAKEAELAKIKPENMAMARVKVLQFFAQYGVSSERIELERKRAVDDWTPQDIVDLRGMATALKEGRISPDKLFPEGAEQPKPKETEPKDANPKDDTTETKFEETWDCVEKGAHLMEALGDNHYKCTVCGFEKGQESHKAEEEEPKPVNEGDNFYNQWINLQHKKFREFVHLFGPTAKEKYPEQVLKMRSKWMRNKALKEEPFPLDAPPVETAPDESKKGDDEVVDLPTYTEPAAGEQQADTTGGHAGAEAPEVSEEELEDTFDSDETILCPETGHETTRVNCINQCWKGPGFHGECPTHLETWGKSGNKDETEEHFEMPAEVEERLAFYEEQFPAGKWLPTINRILWTAFNVRSVEDLPPEEWAQVWPKVDAELDRLTK